MVIKVCKYCGEELTEDDPVKRKQCSKCSGLRLIRWHELINEAKRKFDEEWTVNYG